MLRLSSKFCAIVDWRQVIVPQDDLARHSRTKAPNRGALMFLALFWCDCMVQRDAAEPFVFRQTFVETGFQFAQVFQIMHHPGG